MEYQQSFKLQDIIPMDELEKILSHFCVATKLITILSDFRGSMLTSEKNTKYYTPFCKQLRLTDCPFEKYCEHSDCLGSLEAARRGTPYIYRCHMGFVEVSAPIIVNDMYLGAILMGQVRTDPEIMEKLPQVSVDSSEIKNNPEYKMLFESSFANASYIPYEQLKAFAGLMATTANFIAQTAVNHTMHDQLNSSHIQNLEVHAQKSELEKNMAFLSLKNLRMRINPHFLFNTLNLIDGLAVLEDAEKTSSAIRALSGTLRLSLKTQEQLITVAEEMECVNNYLYIQEISMKGRVRFECNVDESCQKALIPLFTIEVLVENACLHGLASVKSGGVLEIDIRSIGKYMHINVTDNGIGMDPAAFPQLESISNNIGGNESGSGLYSMISNLRYFFNDEARWNISRPQSGGTHVQLIVPLSFSTSQQTEKGWLPIDEISKI